MIKAKNFIENFKQCSIIYYSNKDSLSQQLMLKLALLELSGWLENAFDELYLSAGKDSDAFNEIKNHIGRCFNFKYSNLKQCLCFCIGINNFNKIKNKFTERDFTRFATSLKTISESRDELAHNHHKSGTTPTYLGLRDIKDNFVILYKGINKIKSHIISL